MPFLVHDILNSHPVPCPVDSLAPYLYLKRSYSPSAVLINPVGPGKVEGSAVKFGYLVAMPSRRGAYGSPHCPLSHDNGSTGCRATQTTNAWNHRFKNLQICSS